MTRSAETRAENPFERFDLDPRSGPAQITARFRELMDEARTEEEKAALRAAWEELTLHPRDRLRAALSTYPEAREEIPLGVDEELPRAVPLRVEELELADLVAPPTVLSALADAPPSTAEPQTLMNDPVLASIVSSGPQKR